MTTTDWLTMMDAAGSGFTPVPDGPYEVIVKEAEAKKTSNNKDMIVAKFQILQGPHANRLVWNNFTISPESPNAMSFFFQHMAVFGMDRNFFAQNPSIEQVAATMVNRPANITVGSKVYQGSPRNEVKKIAPSMGGVPMANPTGLPPAAPAQPAPVPPAQPLPAPAPVPVAPVAPAPVPVAPQPVPQPVAAVPAPVAPAPVAPVPVAAPPVVAQPAPVVPEPQPVAVAPVVAPVPAAPPQPVAPVVPVAEPVPAAPVASAEQPVAPVPSPPATPW